MDIKSSVKRTLSAFKADMIFQAKQGFLIVYLAVAIIYIIILSQLPDSILTYAVPIIIFTDPSILGLIFIGGILMLEKEQGITNSLAVTPLRFYEYIVSKIISLGMLSLIIGLVISLASYSAHVNYLIVVAVILLVSMFFTLLGYIIAESCSSVNQFILKAVPFITLFIIPCFSLIGFKWSEVFYIIPSVSALKLMIGAYVGISPLLALGIILYLIFCNIILTKIAKRTYDKKFLMR